MRDIKFGVAFFLRDSARAIVEKVRLVEELGYDSVWLAEAPLHTPELYTLMTTALHNTSRITVGSGVTTVVTRHTSITAAALATLAELFPGRVGARFGLGGTSVTAVGVRPSRLAEFQQGMHEVAALLRGETVNMNGSDFRLRWAKPELTRQVRLYTQMGPGPNSQRTAGTIGLPVSLSTGANEIPDALRRIGEGMAAAGRSPRDVRLSWWSQMSISSDWQMIKEHMLETVATHIRSDLIRRASVEMSPRPGVPPDLGQRLADAYHPSQHGDPRAPYAQILMDQPESVWKAFLGDRLVGTPDEVLAILQTALRHQEVFEVIVGPRQPTERLSVEQLLETFAREVRPRIQAQLGATSPQSPVPAPPPTAR
jgi:alkanesulfonate monooxygenase SsuD/methylene tetrahydromethanopterin reductase-like flavin-dependent oxidoreductase (luciferase family)